MSAPAITTPRGKTKPACQACCDARPLNVFMLDLLPAVPYYTGHLCRELQSSAEINLRMAASTYYLDRGFYRTQGIRKFRGTFDLTAGWRKAPAILRRLIRVPEYLINLLVLLLRFLVVKPDVLHVQFLPMLKFGLRAEVWFLRAVRALGVRIIYTVHNVLPQDTGLKHAGTFEEVYQLVDRLICHDSAAQERLVNEFQISPSRISIIPHGPLFDSPPARSSSRARQSLGIPADARIALWQGILRPYKGVHFLLNAWKDVQATSPRAQLIIVGTGEPSFMRSIEEAAEKLGILSSVRLDLRFVTVSELTDYYLAADILVYPYSEITTSGALMTGLRYGKAIVASRLPAFAGLLSHRDNAMLVDYGDTRALSGTLNQLIADETLRARLGRRAAETNAMTPEWADIATKTVACYRPD